MSNFGRFGISILLHELHKKRSISVGRNEVLMTVPIRAKSVPTGTQANLERGEIFQDIYWTQEDRSRNTLLNRSDPLIAVLRERGPRSFFIPRLFSQNPDKELPARQKLLLQEYYRFLFIFPNPRFESEKKDLNR